MKIVHICTNYKGGAGKAAFRLHNALLDQGMNSTFVSLGTTPITDAGGKESVLVQPGNTIFHKIRNRFRKRFSIFHPFANSLNAVRKNLDYTIVSLPVSDYKIHRLNAIKEADIIHLHGVAFIMDYKSFFENLDKPVVWTLHDINPIGGIFHLRSDEYRNKCIADALEAIIKNYKQQCYQCIKRAAIVAPSAWLLEESIQRQVFENFPHYEIANPIPNVFFEKSDKILDKSSEILPGHFTILFAIADFSDSNKGLDLLEECLKHINCENIQLLIVGNGDISVFAHYKQVNFGYINNDAVMAAIYQRATLLVLPSRDENLPNVMLEAFASGTPVVSFDIGGMSQYVKNGYTGMLAAAMNGVALASAVNAVLSEPEIYSEDAIRKFAFENFHERNQAAKYKEVYGSFFK